MIVTKLCSLRTLIPFFISWVNSNMASHNWDKLLVLYFYIDICVESRYGHISHICSLQALPFPPYSWGYTACTGFGKAIATIPITSINDAATNITTDFIP